MISMDDLEQFDAFQRCREFVRAVAELLNRGIFSRDPVLVTQNCAKDDSSQSDLEFRDKPLSD